jgi:hypothetical protein
MGLMTPVHGFSGGKVKGLFIARSRVPRDSTRLAQRGEGQIVEQ